MSKKKPAKKSAAKTTPVWTDEEREAMRDHVKERKAAQSGGGADEEGAVLAKIAGMPPPDRALAERLHALIKATAPHLTSRLWYGMPAYAKDGKTVCFFQDARKFKTRYATLGFSDKAALDDGDMWPVTFAVKTWTAAGEATIRALVKKAVS